MNKFQFHKTFSTPIYTSFIDLDLANKIEDIIIPELPKLEYVERVNTDFFNKERTISLNKIPSLVKFIEEEVINYSKSTYIKKGKLGQYWIQDYKNDDNHPFHCHPGATISGVYYVRANEHAGNLQFKNPNPYIDITVWEQEIKSLNNINYFNVPPKKGLLVLFPSWLTHWVLPSNNNGCIRTSLAFNYYSND